MWPEGTWTYGSNFGGRVKSEVESGGSGRNVGRCGRANGQVGDEEEGARGGVVGRDVEKVLQDNP